MFKTKFAISLRKGQVCTQNMYISTIENTILTTGFTSLKGICTHLKVSYRAAKAGKRVFLVGEKKVQIIKITVEKVKGRGKLDNSKYLHQ